MLADEIVDRGLIGGYHLGELQAHAVAAIRPGEAALGVNVLGRARQAEAHLHYRPALERVGSADRETAVADVQRERRGDRIAKPVRDRDTKHYARAGTAIVLLGEEMRRERG